MSDNAGDPRAAFVQDLTQRSDVFDLLQASMRALYIMEDISHEMGEVQARMVRINSTVLTYR